MAATRPVRSFPLRTGTPLDGSAVRDQPEHRHELVARRVENRHVAVGERAVDDVVGLERGDGRVDQRLVHDADAGGLERRERSRLDFVPARRSTTSLMPRSSTRCITSDGSTWASESLR